MITMKNIKTGEEFKVHYEVDAREALQRSGGDVVRIGGVCEMASVQTPPKAIQSTAGQMIDPRPVDFTGKPGATITKAQRKEIEKAAKEKSLPVERITQTIGVDSVDQIPATMFDNIMQGIKAYTEQPGE